MNSKSMCWASVAAIFLTAVAFSGCGEEKPTRKYRTLEGIAESVDPAGRQVAMRWYHVKSQQWRVVKGQVTDETEVLINGRSSKLEDVRAGDPVKVIGYQEGKGLNVRLVVTKVLVTREHLTTTPSPDPPSATAAEPGG